MSDSYIVHLFDYLQKDKIDQIYGQLVDRSEKTSTKQIKKDKGKQFEGQAGLGNLLVSLGLAVSSKASSSSGHSEAIETSYEISYEQKIRVIWDILKRQDGIGNLNKCIKNRINPSPSVVLVNFKAVRVQFSFVEDSRNDLPHQAIKVSGLIEDYKTEFYCSLHWFQESSVSFDIQNKVTRDINGIAALKKISHKNKVILINPIAF